MRRGAMGVTANVGGCWVAVMASAARFVVRRRRLRSVLVIATHIRLDVNGCNDDSDATGMHRRFGHGDHAGMHRRFGHGDHAGLQRRHDQQDKRKCGTKPHKLRKSKLTKDHHILSFDTCSGVKSRRAMDELSAEIEM